MSKAAWTIFILSVLLVFASCAGLSIFLDEHRLRLFDAEWCRVAVDQCQRQCKGQQP